MQLFVNKISDALRYHLLPFLIESGYQFVSEGAGGSETEAAGFQPKMYFISRFIELINGLIAADIHMQQCYRLSSGVQDRLLNNSHFLDYMLNLLAFFKLENRRKLLVFLSLVVSSYDTRCTLNFGQLTESLMTLLATHKQTLMLAGHSQLMLAMRTLLHLHERRLGNIHAHSMVEKSTSSV
jgi:hypothetical protein